MKHYRGRVVGYFHDFPLSEAAQSIDAAIASDMAFRKGKYLQMHSLLYQSQSDLTRDRILQLGARCGIVLDELAAALSSEANRRKVSREYRAGRSAGVRATPTVLIGGRSILGRRDLLTYVRRVAELIQDRMLASTWYPGAVNRPRHAVRAGFTVWVPPVLFLLSPTLPGSDKWHKLEKCR